MTSEVCQRLRIRSIVHSLTSGITWRGIRHRCLAGFHHHTLQVRPRIILAFLAFTAGFHSLYLSCLNLFGYLHVEPVPLEVVPPASPVSLEVIPPMPGVYLDSSFLASGSHHAGCTLHLIFQIVFIILVTVFCKSYSPSSFCP